MTLTSTSPVITAYHPLPDDSPCYALVGLIAAEQSRIEYMLDAIIWNLADVEPAVLACLTGQFMGLPSRYNAIGHLLLRRDLYVRFGDRINKQIADSHGLAEARNRAIHDPWFEESATSDTYQFTSPAKKNSSFGNKAVSTSDLEKTLRRFRDFHARVIDLRNDVWDATHP